MTVWNRYETLFLWHGLRCDGVECVWVVDRGLWVRRTRALPS